MVEDVNGNRVGTGSGYSVLANVSAIYRLSDDSTILYNYVLLLLQCSQHSKVPSGMHAEYRFFYHEKHFTESAVLLKNLAGKL